MADPRPIFVIKHGRSSYVQAGSDYWTRDRLIVNGSREWPKAKGDGSYMVVTGAVTSVQRFNDPQKVITRYEIRPDLACAPKQPWLTPAEYGALPEGDQVIYSAVIEEREVPPTDLAFTVVDGDAPPRTLPPGVSPATTHHIDTLPAFWWTLPVQMTRKEVYRRFVEVVRQLDPAEFHVTAYPNIGHLRIDTGALVIGGVTYTTSKALVHFDRENSWPWKMEAENLDALERKVTEWIEAQLAPVRAAQAITTCPCCARPLPKSVIARRRSHADPRRRSQHEIHKD